MSCLFNSLSYFIKEDSNIIRNKICDYLEENKQIIEIQVACNIWKCKIIVYNYRDIKHSRIDFYPISCKHNNIYEIEWSGGHYEPKKN